MNIGRGTPLGNPFLAFGHPDGTTIPFYESFIMAILKDDLETAKKVINDAKNKNISVSRDQCNLIWKERKSIPDLLLSDPRAWYCPGCKNKTSTSICHGSILLKLRFLFHGE